MTGPQFITRDAPPVLIFGGKGGVGKTTSAAAAALALAREFPDECVMLVSTDPAHSINDALAGMALPNNLTVTELDAGAEHAEFMARHGESLHAIAARGTFLDDDQIARFLDLSVPGVDELMCFVRLAQWFDNGVADRYVIDTAPTGHALRLLAIPDVLSGWFAAIDALLGKHRYMSSVFGSAEEDPVEAFVEDISESFENVAGVWCDATLTRFVPVFNAEPLSIAETSRLLDDLDTLGIASSELVLNRVVGLDASGGLASLRTRQHQAIASLPESLAERTIWAVPLSDDEPRGDLLVGHYDSAISLDEMELHPDEEIELAPGQVDGTLRLPDGSRSLTLVAGKGGVGKTTMSCAAALAQAGTGRRVLLVSTDPAGSLGDAFEVAIGPDPVSIAPDLDAIQLDAERELAALKSEYADELAEFLDSLSMDLSFDREALEHLLELAPTGIDEVMALVRMTEILDSEHYESLIIDTAPTGHTLRLLELPEVVQQWLEQIFNVLVHYEDLINLPRLNERLLRLSQGLKRLRAMLADAHGTSVVTVTIPTRLGVAEAERLIGGCGSMGVPVSGVIVNQLTPAGDDVSSTAIRSREATEVAAMRDAAGSLPVCTVERRGDLRGVEALNGLGSRMFTSGGASQRSAA